MRKLSVIMLFSIFCILIRIQAHSVLYGITLTTAQQDTLTKLMRIYKDQLERHCTLCYLKPQKGVEHYKKLNEKEWNHFFKESAQHIQKTTIQSLINFYKEVGLPTQDIEKEINKLQNGLSCWCDESNMIK